MYQAGRFFYQDTGSRNGSYLNSAKLTAGVNKQLSDGDLLCLADPRDKDKIFAKVHLCYPHVHDSLVPDSLEGPLEKSLDRTAPYVVGCLSRGIDGISSKQLTDLKFIKPFRR